jgi:hypothetical protein
MKEPEKTPQEIQRIKDILLNGFDIQFTHDVYVMKRYARGEKTYMRFFIITGPGDGIKRTFKPRLTEITKYVSALTRFSGRVYDGAFWILTHPTNDLDVVQSLSHELFGVDNKLNFERL